jgi:hypothetical protein
VTLLQGAQLSGRFLVHSFSWLAFKVYPMQVFFKAPMC